ncbi:MAG: hypothetical protein HQL66_12570 [Magnetococcales bacterium]|nr:hypothetical protein [Magnetococcales bacterium]
MLYPSLMLYTSMALRDGLIMVFTVLGVYFFLEKRYIQASLFHFPLAIIKFQNFLIFIVALMLFIFTSKRVNIVYRVLIIMFISAVAVHFSDFITVDEINRYRRWMYYENHNSSTEGYVNVETYWDVAFLGLMSAPYMIMKPLPWEAENMFQLLQSFENIVIDYMVVISVYYSILNKNLRNKMWFLNLYFFVGMSIYGLVVDNFGTAARYKYPFVTFYLLFFLHYYDAEIWRRWKERVQMYWLWSMARRQYQIRSDLPA